MMMMLDGCNYSACTSRLRRTRDTSIPATASSLPACPPRVARPRRAATPRRGRRVPATAGGMPAILPYTAPPVPATADGLPPRLLSFRVPPISSPSSCVCLLGPRPVGFRGPAACVAQEAHHRHVCSIAKDFFSHGSNLSTSINFWFHAGIIGQAQDWSPTSRLTGMGHAPESVWEACRGPVIAGESGSSAGSKLHFRNLVIRSAIFGWYLSSVWPVCPRL